MNKAAKPFAAILLSFLLTSMAFGHAEVSEDSNESAELYSSILTKVANFQLENSPEDNGPTAKFNKRGKLTSLVFGKKYINIDNGFWDLTDEISKLYINELSEACNDCKLPSVEEINAEVKSLVSQGWVSKAGIGLGNIFVERYGLEFANLAFRYGYISGIIKVIGELVEDALLVVFKMPNAHFLCEVITYYIAIYSRTVNTTLRALTLPRHYKSSRIMALARVLATSYVTRRALKRLDVEVPSFTVHDEELQRFLTENEETRLTDRVLDYAAHELEERGLEAPANSIETSLQKRHRLQKFLSSLSKKIRKKQQKFSKKDLPNDEKEELASDLSVMTTIYRKVFEGKRYKRFLFLKKRRKAKSLGEFATSSKILKGSEFWFFSLKNDLLTPHVSYNNTRNFTPAQQEEVDPLTAWQSRQVSSEEGRKFLSDSLLTISRILDPSLKRTDRYFDFKLMDSFLTAVLPGIAQKIIDQRIDELNFDKTSFGNAASIWGLKFKTYKRLSTFIGQIDVYTDLLRFGAVNKRTPDITSSLHSREYFLQILKIFDFISTFSNVTTADEIKSFNLEFSEHLKKLKASRYWIEKKNRTFSTNAIFGRYRCEALY